MIVKRMAPPRSTAEVFEDHLHCRTAGKLEKDLQRNYSPEVVLPCEHGAFCGIDAVRKSGQELIRQLPEARFEFFSKYVEGEFAFLQWRADSAINRVLHGADSFVIRNDRIVMHSVDYVLEPKSLNIHNHNFS
jgi:hypothetical protein